jgi:cupin fold WbuC family metalloprotein
MVGKRMQSPGVGGSIEDIMSHPALLPGYRFVTPEVLYSDASFVTTGDAEIAMLKAIAADTPRKRARICTHPDPGAAQQEMLIVMHRSGYVRPHRHYGKTETFLVLDGEVDALLFADDGTLQSMTRMGAPGSSRSFFYRMPEGQYHGLIYRSEWLVFIETTKGPFSLADTEAAPWAPPETEQDAGRAFYAALEAAPA